MTQTLYDQAIKIIRSSKRTDCAFLSRQLGIEFDAAVTLIKRMEKDGVISAENGQGKRKILVKEATMNAATNAAMGDNNDPTAPLMTEIARDKLRTTVERIERLEEEKKEIAEQVKEVYGEAKALGYDTKALRAVVKLRKQDRTERQEQEAILEVYLDALGEL